MKPMKTYQKAATIRDMFEWVGDQKSNSFFTVNFHNSDKPGDLNLS